MTPDEILQKLNALESTRFEREALEAASNYPEELTPHLLEIMARVAKNIDWLFEYPDYTGHVYAIYLLAQFKENQAYPLIIEFFSQPEISEFEELDSVITEDLHKILASVSPGDVRLIKQMAENPALDVFIRNAALQALIVLYNEAVIEREEVIAYYHSLLKRKWEINEDLFFRGSFLTWVVVCCAELYPEEIYDDIRQAFADDQVDTEVIDLEWFDDNVFCKSKTEILSALKENKDFTYIDSAVAEMENWMWYKDETKMEKHADDIKKVLAGLENFKRLYPDNTEYDDEDFRTEPPKPEIYLLPGQTSHEKVGRNDLCPCGSGKKFKKCCLN